MKNLSFGIARISVPEAIFSELASCISGFFTQIQEESKRVKRRVDQRRKMQKYVYQETIAQMPIEQKLRLGIFRF